MAKLSTVAAIEPHHPLHTEVAAAPAIHVPATQRFLYLCRPDRCVIMHGRVLPALVKLIVEPGVNLVDARGNPSPAIEERRRRGWTLIPEDIAGPGTSYLALRTNANGQAVWLDQHAIVHHGSALIGDGSVAYAEWLGGLVDDGKLDPPLAYVVASVKDEISEAAMRLEDRAQKSEAIELRTLQANIEACDRFLSPPKKSKKAAK